MNKQQILFIAILFLSLITACKKEDNSPQPSTSAKDSTYSQSLYINQFIWSNMSAYYLWTDSVSNLSYTYFNNDTNKINSFLKGYTDHEKLFKDLLYKPDVVDKWSWIEKNYQTLQDELSGKSKSMGYDFRLGRFSSNSDNLFGFVRYVYKGSPAEKAGIKRGDFFTAVNNTTLTISNYQTLLFGSDSYTLNMATYNGSTLVPNSKSVSLTAVELQENPIFLDTVYTVNNTKIGYLIYNGFYSDFDLQLNQVFQEFKNKGIQKLILDLRYNGGGSVQSAIYLASMIYGTYTDKVFCKNQYNPYLNQYLVSNYGSDVLVSKFESKIASEGTNPEAAINTLNLNNLYVITTESTASASELIINGLRAYIPVTTIGTTTVGKNVGSMTITDEDANGKVNPNNTWAMQLIILKIANSLGASNYANGFAPNVEVEEDITNMLPLGRTDETLLSSAIATATGQAQTKAKRIPLNVQYVAESKDFMPHAKEMYVKLPKIKK